MTVKALAARAGKSQRSVERAVTVVRHAPPEVQAQLRSGRLTLGGAERAMKSARAPRNGTGEATAATAKPATAPAAPPAVSDEPLPFARVAKSFVDTTTAVVRNARVWNREALEQLSHTLGQIETSLRDGSMRACEEPR